MTWAETRRGELDEIRGGTLGFVTIDAAGLAAQPVLLVETDLGWIGDTAIAFGAGQFAVATQDTIDPSSYEHLTLVDPEGCVHESLIPVASERNEGSVDLAWGGNAFAVVSTLGPYGPGASVLLRQIDPSGSVVQDPLVAAVSGGDIDDVGPRIVTTGFGQYLVVWQESSESSSTFVLRGARVDCSP